MYLRERAIKYWCDAPYQALQNLIEWQSKFPTHTKRSEDTYNYQQFSSPLPLSFLVAQAAGITCNDMVLEPSAGNGMLAIWSYLARAKLILNELHQQRQQNLTALFPQAAVTGFNGEQIHDFLPQNYQPTVVVMNPPFSRTPKVGKRSSSATARHHSPLPAPSDASETAPPKLRLVQSEEAVDLNDIVEVKYSIIESHPEGGELSDGIYERYQPQTVKIAGAKKHPTPLVEATAMASIKPPVPDYKPHLPRQVIEGGILSDAQIEAIIYAGQAHQEFLSGWYLVDETLDRVKRASEGDEGAVRFRKAFFIGSGTGNPLQLKITKQQQQRPLFLFTVKL